MKIMTGFCSQSKNAGVSTIFQVVHKICGQPVENHVHNYFRQPAFDAFCKLPIFYTVNKDNDYSMLEDLFDCHRVKTG